MRKASFFSLIGAVLLAVSSWSFASVPTGVGVYGYDVSFAVMYLPALDQPAEHVPIVADTSHTAVTPILGIVANWQPGGAYKLLMPSRSRVVRRFAACAGHTEVGWHRHSV